MKITKMWLNLGLFIYEEKRELYNVKEGTRRKEFENWGVSKNTIIKRSRSLKAHTFWSGRNSSGECIGRKRDLRSGKRSKKFRFHLRGDLGRKLLKGSQVATQWRRHLQRKDQKS